MTVASEISRLQCAKADIKTAIEGKGVEVGNNLKLDEYAECIGEIQQGATEGILPITAPTLTGVAEHGKNCLKLNDPDNDSCRGTQLTCWKCSTVVRKVGSSPTSETDGTVIFRSTTKDQCASTYYVDTGLTNGCTYHYRAFADVSVGKPNCSSVLCLTPTAGAKIDVMLVGGGGAGGTGTCSNGCSGYVAGGGGGGGQVVIRCGVNIGATTTVTIGAGGTGGYGGARTNGGNTVLGSVTAYGGGHGGDAYEYGGSGGNGGGGGGSCYCCSGGTGCNYCGGAAYSSRGGGGAGAGSNGYQNTDFYCREGGDGGKGCTTNFTGKNETFAGGGGGGSDAMNSSTCCCGRGGSGGGGNGANRDDKYGCDATFYGGGGGGGVNQSRSTGGNGYKGLAVIRYLISCGYTITGGQCCYTCNGYKYHCFTSNGTIIVS